MFFKVVNFISKFFLFSLKALLPDCDNFRFTLSHLEEKCLISWSYQGLSSGLTVTCFDDMHEFTKLRKMLVNVRHASCKDPSDKQFQLKF